MMGVLGSGGKALDAGITVCWGAGMRYGVFDLDGTLSDPIVGIERSINYALTHFGHRPLERAAVAAYIGPPLDEAFRAITGVTGSREIAAYVAKYRERYAEIGYAENTLYSGIAEVLRDLSAAGIPLGVCTSKRVDFAERILERFELRSLFDFVDGGEVGIQKSRQIRDLVATGRIARTSIMIGDRDVDLQAAHGNGLSAGGVLWGYGSAEELLRENPRYLFRSPGDLVALREIMTPARSEKVARELS